MVTEAELSSAIAEATRHAYYNLVHLHPESYYYFSLITTGEAHPPVIAAWSHEALAAAIAERSDRDQAASWLKWSYADSPYFCFGETYFAKVQELFRSRPDIRFLSDAEREEEFELRLRAMENAVASLNSAGVFGTGKERESIVVTVEVMPPDFSNTERTIRLNPPRAIKDWLEEIAEVE